MTILSVGRSYLEAVLDVHRALGDVAIAVVGVAAGGRPAREAIGFGGAKHPLPVALVGVVLGAVGNEVEVVEGLIQQGTTRVQVCFRPGWGGR